MRLRLVFAAAMTAIVTVLDASSARADSELAVTHPTFYVIAPGSDASIAPIASAVTARLQVLFDRAAASQATRVWVIPRLGWSPDDLQNQCANDPTKNSPTGAKVLGGLILDGTNSYAGASESYFLWIRGWTKVTTHADLVSCGPVGFNTPTITWMSDGLEGYSSRNGFPVGTGAAVGLYLGSNASSDVKSFALGTAISGFDSTSSIPPVDPATEMHDAAHRAANQLIDNLVGACTAGTNADIRPMCYRLGLAPEPPPTPVPSPTPKPTPSDG
ncbi:MAG TPA: hypothetical protein VMF61_12315 [Candidatus Acidoferrales bacterium]|nr:hypothetical protein [Candidatus Acidoferrales bacterium]